MLAGCAGAIGSELFVPPTRLRRAEAIVALGYWPPVDAHGALTPELERRMQRAVELWRAGLAPILVVTGGSRADRTEADAMAARARELGVPESAIVIERRAHDTAENARYSVEALCSDPSTELGTGRAPCAPEVIVVSSPYHVRRAARLFECAGAHVQIAACEGPPDLGSQVDSTLHEYGVAIAYVFDDACSRATPGRSRSE